MKKKVSLLGFITGFCVFLVGLLVWGLTPRTALAAACDVPAGFATIQAAVNDMSCTTINIAAGTYNENLAIGRSITLTGAAPSTTIIDGGGTDRVIDFTLNSGKLIVSNLTIQNGSTTSTGGGLNLALNASADINNSNFFTNTAQDGGAIFASRSDAVLTIADSLFVNNKATAANPAFAQGGAINVGGVAALSVTDSSFYGNEAGNDGGTIFVQASAGNRSEFELDSIEIVKSISGDDGGAVYANHANLTINKSSFISNTARSDGGAIAHVLGSVTVNNGFFNLNTSGKNLRGHGGAFYFSSSSPVIIERSQFVENESIGGNRGRGGAIHYRPTVNGSLIVTGSVFMSNTGGTRAAYYQQAFVGGNPHDAKFTHNCLVGNGDTAVVNTGMPILDATGNWWGDASGPSEEGPGTGESVGTDVDFSNFTTAPINISSGCPILAIMGALANAGANIPEGSSAELNIAIDPNPPLNRSAETYTLTIDYNDGTIETLPTTLPTLLTHEYQDDGVFAAVVTAVDRFGRIDTITNPITITNSAPQVLAGSSQTVEVGAAVTVTGTFTDGGSLDTHDIVWDMGDGTLISDSLTATHNYVGSGTFTVTLTITDDDGGVGVDQFTIIVQVPSAIELFGVMAGRVIPVPAFIFALLFGLTLGGWVVFRPKANQKP